MKFLWLLASNLGRHKLRTAFTLGSIVIAFLLFGLLSATEKAFLAGADMAGEQRLVTIHKVTLIQPLPLSYLGRIQSVPGVSAVSHASWLGGLYQDSRNDLPVFPTDERYLEIYPEIVMPESQRRAWLENRTGMIAGKVLADKYGWKIGDVIPIRSSIWRKQDGGDTWDLRLDAIYTAGTDGIDESTILMHYEYFNESRPEEARDIVGWYVVEIEDPDRAPEIAAAIDQRFANSPAETKTSTEKAFAQSFANQIGNIGAIITAVVSAVFFTMLLVIANTMGQAVRERTSELAVLKTIGFSGVTVMGLVLAEALTIAIVGGAVGLGLAYLVVETAGDVVRQRLGVFYLPPEDVAVGIGLILLAGILAGALPAAQALRLRVADALRRT